MATKTISLSEDAYERLKAMKRENESFSDVVRRLTRGVELEDYYGILDEDTGAELAAVVERRREAETDAHDDRVDGVAEQFDG
jgi:predicted CopG family antitoxin